MLVRHRAMSNYWPDFYLTQRTDKIKFMRITPEKA